MLGGWKGGRSKSVLMCSLANLLQSCSETSSDLVWHRIADVPVYHSTCATVNGELVAVGGRDAEDKSTGAVHRYKQTVDSWEVISHMPTARSYSLVVVLPTPEMMVVGGYTIRVVLTNIIQ